MKAAARKPKPRRVLAKAGSERARKAAVSSAAGQVAVRMYNVGFGDCFLLVFPAEDRPRKILIDCGFHAAGPPPGEGGLDAVVEQILEDVHDDGQPRVDVLVCTHRHRDHVFGFESKAWERLRVGEVWMPWTEDPDDPEARRIRDAQSKKARDLALALQGLTLDAEARAGIKEIIDNSLTNAEAMATLHHGFAGSPRRRFLPETLTDGTTLRRSMKPRLLAGVTVHVLGPSRERDVIREMDPPPDESFLRAARAALAGGAREGPFSADWSISTTGDGFRAWFEELREKARGQVVDPQPPLRSSDPDFSVRWFASLGLRFADLQAVDRAGEDDAFAAAVALDKAVNGTSLMLMFEIGRAFLLFPGDAQWGTWNRALTDPQWRELLGKTTFYKVGHHGSHNATPVQFVEDVLGRSFQAMVSTRETKRFKKIPRLPLLDALSAKSTAVVRSDAGQVTTPFRRVNELCIEARVTI